MEVGQGVDVRILQAEVWFTLPKLMLNLHSTIRGFLHTCIFIMASNIEWKPHNNPFRHVLIAVC